MLIRTSLPLAFGDLAQLAPCHEELLLIFKGSPLLGYCCSRFSSITPAPTLSSVHPGEGFLNVPQVLGLGFIVINTGRWCYPDKRCFQPHSLAHVDGTFTVAEPHFLTSFHRHIRWGAQHQLINFKLVDQCWRPSPRFVGITCTQRRRSP